MKKYDIFFIGGGVGGYTGAEYASRQGLQVGLAEKGYLGGTCTNRGCIPTKFLFSVAKSIAKTRKFSKIEQIDFQSIKSIKDEIVSRLRRDIEFLLKKSKVDIFSAEVTDIRGKELKVGEEWIYADKIVLATGSKPHVLGGFGFDGIDILSSTDVFEMESLPENLLIIGGGYIGMELATIFLNLGVAVTIVEQREDILFSFSRSFVKRFKAILSKKYPALTIFINSSARVIKKIGGSIEVEINGQKGQFDKVIVAVGRMPNYPEWLYKAGVDFHDNGAIKLDSCYRAKPDFYVIGDAANRFQLAYTAEYEAKKVVDVVLGRIDEITMPTIPYTIFTIPEIAFCGNVGGENRLFRFNYLASGKALADLAGDGTIRAFVNKNEELVGAEIIGENATELIHFFSLLIDWRIPISQLKERLFAHPTYSEVVKKIFE